MSRCMCLERRAMCGKFVIGIDFGSDSVRAILVDVQTAKTLQMAVAEYPRWKEKKYCAPFIGQYRQHPLDYLECLEKVIVKVLKGTLDSAEKVAGIAIDTTGSTVCPVDENGVPLALKKEFQENPEAMFHLWKDHTSVKEAKELNYALSHGEVDYTKYQGEYSSEWFWAKILRTVRQNPDIRQSAYCWVEHVDWITGVLTGNTSPVSIIHCSCAAGHKALWNSEFGGLPSKKILASVDEYLGGIYDLYSQIPRSAGEVAGIICENWAQKLGLSRNVVIGVGSFDAHAGAVGVGIREKIMVKAVGTSTVDLMIIPRATAYKKESKAYCGLAENSIIPGYMGVESGQSAFGDTYAWLKRILLWSVDNILAKEGLLNEEMLEKIRQHLSDNILRELEEQAKYIEEDALSALDWFNGRRYPHLNENVKSMISGLTLSTTPPELYRALVEATVFGSRRIYDSLKKLGIEMEQLICVGGIARKSPYIMQMMADVLNIPLMVSKEDQSCARGAAIYAAVAAGLYNDIQQAQEIFCEKYVPSYYPNPDVHQKLEEKYKKYCRLGQVAEETLL